MKRHSFALPLVLFFTAALLGSPLRAKAEGQYEVYLFALQGPACGGPRACPDAPVQNAIIRIDRLGKRNQIRESFEVTTNEHGYASITLSQRGRYRATPAAPSFAPQPYASVTFSLPTGGKYDDRTNAPTNVLLRFDSGIR